MSDKPEVVAWLHEDGERVVTATALAAANRDAGASADFKTPLVLQIGYIEERELRFSVEARWMAEKERGDTLSARVAELEGENARLQGEIGRRAWAGVPDAAEWVREIRGHDAAMRQGKGETPAPTCVWTYDDTDNAWDAPCGSKWCFIEGDPEDNGVKFCQKCGKPVRLVADTPAKEGR